METRSDMQPAQSETAKSNTEAELIFTFANRAPEVVLAFEGLAVPTPLFVDLNRLGWTIPAVPPPPSAAIDWTPDPVTGADYTLRPWRVTEFRLDSGTWAESSERAIGGLTIEVLKRHSVKITDLRGLSEAEIQAATGATAAAPAAAGVPAEAASAAAPPAAATTGAELIVIFDPEAGATMQGFRTWTSNQGRKKAECTWHEGSLSEGAQVPNAEQISDLSGRGGGVWHLSGDTRPASGAANILQMLAPDIAPDSPDLKKLLKLTGAGTTVTPLASLTGGKNAVLLSAKVPGHSVDMLATNLRVRFPNLVFRES